jgi:hypothetical protein
VIKTRDGIVSWLRFYNKTPCFFIEPILQPPGIPEFNGPQGLETNEVSPHYKKRLYLSWLNTQTTMD